MPRALPTLPFKPPRQSMHIRMCIRGFAKPRMITSNTSNTNTFYHTHIAFQHGGILVLPNPALPASEQSQVTNPSKISPKYKTWIPCFLKVRIEMEIFVQFEFVPRYLSFPYWRIFGGEHFQWKLLQAR